MTKKKRKVFISKTENDQLWEKDYNQAIKECDIKFHEKHGTSLIGLIMGFTEELVELCDAASLIGLSRLLDGSSEDVMGRIVER